MFIGEQGSLNYQQGLWYPSASADIRLHLPMRDIGKPGNLISLVEGTGDKQIQKLSLQSWLGISSFGFQNSGKIDIVAQYVSNKSKCIMATASKLVQIGESIISIGVAQKEHGVIDGFFSSDTTLARSMQFRAVYNNNRLCICILDILVMEAAFDVQAGALRVWDGDDSWSYQFDAYSAQVHKIAKAIRAKRIGGLAQYDDLLNQTTQLYSILNYGV